MEAFNNLGINLSGLVVYLVNFGIVLAVLTKYLYKPLTKYVDERRATIKRNLEEAEELKNSFQEEMRSKEQQQEQTLRSLQTELAGAKAFAEEKAKEALAEIQAERSRILEETERQAAQMKKDMLAEAEADILNRIKAVVTHVVKDAVPADKVGASVESAWKSSKGDIV